MITTQAILDYVGNDPIERPIGRAVLVTPAGLRELAEFFGRPIGGPGNWTLLGLPIVRTTDPPRDFDPRVFPRAQPW